MKRSYFAAVLALTCALGIGTNVRAQNVDGVVVTPDLCTEFGLEGDCLLNFGHPRFCRIGFMTSTESLPL